MKTRTSARSSLSPSPRAAARRTSLEEPRQLSEPEPEPETETETETEWRMLRAVFTDAIECAIGHACERVGDFPEDVAALEHLRDFARSRIEGLPCAMRVSDLLQALGILLGAFEAERCAPSLAGYSLHTTTRRMRDLAHAVGIPYADPFDPDENAQRSPEDLYECMHCAARSVPSKSAHETGIRPARAERRTARAVPFTKAA